MRPSKNRVSSREPESPPTSALPWAEGRALRGLRVLIVEDDPAFAEFLAWSLSERGYAIELAVNIAEALALLGDGDGPAPFDLVLSDIALPGAPGTDLLFSQTVVLRKTPVVLMSGFANNELQIFVEACGGEFLSKPFKLDSLFQCVSGRLQDLAATPPLTARPT